MIDRIFLQKYSAKEENIRFYNAFINYLYKSHKKESTIERYKVDIENYLDFLAINNFYILEMYEEEIEAYFFYLQINDCAKDAILRRFSVISTFYKHIIKQGWLEENPIKILKKGDYDKKFVLEDNVLNLSQIKRIRKDIIRHSSHQKSAYFELMISGGIKAHCIPNIKWTQVDFENKRIVNIVEKKDKVVTIYFSERTKKALLKMREESQEKEPDFEFVFRTGLTTFEQQITNRKYQQIKLRTVKTYMDYFARIAEVPFLSAFNLRVTCGHILVNGGMSKEDISFLLNHRTDAGSIIYENVNLEPLLKQKDIIQSKFGGRW